jgi:hypothetical protein
MASWRRFFAGARVSRLSAARIFYSLVSANHVPRCGKPIQSEERSGDQGSHETSGIHAAHEQEHRRFKEACDKNGRAYRGPRPKPKPALALCRLIVDPARDNDKGAPDSEKGRRPQNLRASLKRRRHVHATQELHRVLALRVIQTI